MSLGVDGGIHALSQVIPEVFAALGGAIRTGNDDRALALHRQAIAAAVDAALDAL